MIQLSEYDKGLLCDAVIKTVSIGRLDSSDIRSKINSRMSLITYAPIVGGIPIKLKHVRFKRGKKSVSYINAKAFLLDDTSKVVLVTSVNSVAGILVDGSARIKRGDFFIDDRQVSISNVGFVQNNSIVLHFLYMNSYQKTKRNNMY